MRFARWALLLCLISACVTASAAPFRFASWNIKHLGWADEDRDYTAAARTLDYFDFIAIQEVMKPEAVETLRTELNRVSGERWDTLISAPIGRGSYKESYAFIWRVDRFSFDGSAAQYIDSRDVFAREPFSAIFSDNVDSSRFLAANVHILYGDSVEDRLPEINALSGYWGWLKSQFGQVPIVLSGDFNLAPDEEAFDTFTADAVPLINTGATTLGTTGGYASLYDNIWVDRDWLATMPRAGIFKYPEVLGLDHEAARANVSDHAPVFAILDFSRAN